MTERSAIHATFAIERHYDASPARVFAAWADPAAKVRWFSCHEASRADVFALDFRVGGHEIHRVGSPGGPVYTVDARYHDIVPDRRIVYAYDLHADETRISVSLVTVEFAPSGSGTRLVFTEQAIFLDGSDGSAEREEGTRSGLERLEAELRQALAAA